MNKSGGARRGIFIFIFFKMRNLTVASLGVEMCGI